MIRNTVLDAMGNTPLVRINRLNPNPQVALLAKVESFNPGGSIKDRVALAMIEDAERSGALHKDKIVIEATSGNTGIGLAMVCAVKGYKLMLLMPETASEERRRIVQAYGADIMLTPAKYATDGAIEKAYRMAREEPDKYLLLDQYNNPSSIEAHYKHTGREIWEQTEGKVTHVVMSLGTTGTAMGVTKRLKECCPDVQIIAVEPYAGHRIQGLKNMKESYPPGIYNKKVLDRVVHVEDELAFETVRQLAREEGLFVGMSSGAAMAAAVRLAQEIDQGMVVAILPDGGERYLSTTLFAPKAKQGLELYNLADSRPVMLESGPKGAGLYTMGPPLDSLDDPDSWRRIVLLDVLAAFLEKQGRECAVVVGLADMDDRALEAARTAGLAPKDHLKQVLSELAVRAAALGVSKRVAFYPASQSVETILGLTKALLARGAAYEKMRSVYFDVLRFKDYGQISSMDLEKLSLGKTVDLADYVKENPQDFTLLKRASLQDLKSGDCLQTEWGNVRPSWFLQLAAVALDRLPELSVFLAGEAHTFPHLENFRGIWNMGRSVEPRAWMACGALVGEAEASESFAQALNAAASDKKSLRMFLLSTAYKRQLTWSDNNLDMWRKNRARVQHLTVELGGVYSGDKAPAKERAGSNGQDVSASVAEALLELRKAFTQALENDLGLQLFWPSLFAFCRDIGKLQNKGLNHTDTLACLELLKDIDAVLGILEQTELPVVRSQWSDPVAGLVEEREQARAQKDYARADSLRERISAQGYRVEDTAEGPRLYLV